MKFCWYTKVPVPTLLGVQRTSVVEPYKSLEFQVPRFQNPLNYSWFLRFSEPVLGTGAGLCILNLFKIQFQLSSIETKIYFNQLINFIRHFYNKVI
jgi:hypothetical protein